MELIQVVPTLPPALSGVGDYAVLLARELEAAQAVPTRFVVGDSAWTGQGSVSFPVQVLGQRSAAVLERALQDAETSGGPGPGVVLLHYVGYGYAHRGCPFWLVTACERWKAGRPGRRLIVLFHELYATGPIWSSVFWTSPWQKRLAARLGRAADARRLTTRVAADQLRALLGGSVSEAPLAATPVFCTLGEPAELPPLAARRRQMIVFGSRQWRQDVYTRCTADLTDTCRQLEIERVIDVGAPLAELPGGGLPIPWEAVGALPAKEASELFAHSLAGYFSYPVPSLAKSTIFAAYCAHGMLPVTSAANDEPNDDGLLALTHYVGRTALPGWGAGDLQRVTDGALGWYREHRLAVHAAGVRAQMEECLMEGQSV